MRGTYVSAIICHSDIMGDIDIDIYKRLYVELTRDKDFVPGEPFIVCLEQMPRSRTRHD